MFESILVPLDGSVLAEQVVPHLARLAAAFHSEVFLLGICEPEEKDAEHACLAYVSNRFASLQTTVGQPTRTRTAVAVGKPAEEIVQFAEKNKVSLIIISSHGRSGLAEWPMGSTADRILRMTGVPTLLIRSRDPEATGDGYEPFRRILVPLDGTASGESALPYAGAIAEKLGSEIVLLRVASAGKKVHTLGGLDYIPYKDQDLETMKRSAGHYLSGLVSRLAGTGVSARSEVATGDPAGAIIRIAGQLACTMIAMASHSHGSIERWFHGSVSYKVLQASKQSVLLVKT